MQNLERYISEDGGVVCVVCNSTEMVREMEQIHTTSAVVSAALGRLLTAASMMGSMSKHVEDSVTLRLWGGGPAGQLIAVSDGRGNVRGYVEQPVVEIPLNEKGKLDVGGAVGRTGTLSVVRDMGPGQIATGTVPLVSGEIAEDVTSYYATSEQIPTVCGLGVLVAPDLTIQSAGGYLVQLMPGVSEEEISRIEANLTKVGPISSLFDEGITTKALAQQLLEGFSPQLLDGFAAGYRCNCSRERVSTALRSIGREDLQSLIDDEQETEVGCHFCGKKYVFSKSELEEMLEKISKHH